MKFKDIYVEEYKKHSLEGKPGFWFVVAAKVEGVEGATKASLSLIKLVGEDLINGLFVVQNEKGILSKLCANPTLRNELFEAIKKDSTMEIIKGIEKHFILKGGN